MMPDNRQTVHSTQQIRVAVASAVAFRFNAQKLVILA